MWLGWLLEGGEIAAARGDRIVAMWGAAGGEGVVVWRSSLRGALEVVAMV